MHKFRGPWLGNYIWPLINLACSAENTAFWQSVRKILFTVNPEKTVLYEGIRLQLETVHQRFWKCEQQEGITLLRTLTAADKMLYAVFRWVPNTQPCGYRHLNWISFSVTEDGYTKLTCLTYTERKIYVYVNKERKPLLSVLGYI